MFSIIIPAYNAEMYIEKCLKSITNQSFNEFEVIIVENASTDHTYTLCKEFADRDSRIKLIHTDTPGVSHARNLGLREACFDWIVFVDADDYLLEDALIILAQQISDSVDLVMANSTQKDEPDQLSGVIRTISSETCILALLDTPQYFSLLRGGLTYNPDILGVNWAKAFRKSIIENNRIVFNESITIFEDFLFNFDFIQHSGFIVCIDKPIYYYRVTDESLSRTKSLNRVIKRIDFIKVLLRYRDETQYKAAFEFFIVQNILRTLVAAGRNKDDTKLVKSIILTLLKDNRVQTAIKKVRSTKLSNGIFQNIAYIVCLCLLKYHCYNTALRFAGFYCKIKRNG